MEKAGSHLMAKMNIPLAKKLVLPMNKVAHEPRW